MDPKNLLNADYLDIIYDKRNKRYGGYELRKHYNRRLKKAVLFAFTGVAALFSFSFINSGSGEKVHRSPNLRPDSVSVVIIPVHPPDKTRIQPPPSAPEHIKMRSLTIPKIEPDKNVPDDKEMTENKDLVHAQPGPANHDRDSIGLASRVAQGSGSGPEISVATKSSQPLRYVEQMPQFAGDMSDYISSHIHYPEMARSTNIEGKVIIEFIVNEDGSVSNAKIIRSIGGGCDEEALHMVNNMPKWKPGKQNGIPVKVYFTLPIKFELN